MHYQVIFTAVCGQKQETSTICFHILPTQKESLTSLHALCTPADTGRDFQFIELVGDVGLILRKIQTKLERVCNCIIRPICDVCH